uniref:Uncharacterized protein n=1 Tax=Rhizophora mucronata TaxID=61149 RepID=A0A2P2Q2I0_RHIMU
MATSNTKTKFCDPTNMLKVELQHSN